MDAMTAYFLCLANSIKYNNRCLAGLALRKGSDGKIYFQYSETRQFVWFRPVSHDEPTQGAVPNKDGKCFELFDIIEVEGAEPCPYGGQQENWYYQRLRKVGRFELSEKWLQLIAQDTATLLFGNAHRSITHTDFLKLPCSLVLIHPSQAHCYLKTNSKGAQKPRMIFTYGNAEYDLPITDCQFSALVSNALHKANAYKEYYLLISLGAEYLKDNCHYKLVAGVFPLHPVSGPQIVPVALKAVKEPKISSVQQTLLLHKEGLTIAQIAQRRKLAVSTISGHLLQCFQEGEIDNILSLVSIQVLSMVLPYLETNKAVWDGKFSSLYEAFQGKFSYEDLRFVVAYWRKITQK